MVSLLLAIIYLAFISLGLPDSLLGSAWPVMRLEFGASLSFAGVISMTICASTIVSSLASDYMTHRFGAGRVTAVSVGMTALALLGFSLSDSLILLCVLAVPYGLGAGAVDAALNNYVALHFAARHMSWLHCFWGVGASISPYIMSACLAADNNWRGGYFSVSVIQIVLTVCLFVTLPLWKKAAGDDSGSASEESAASVGIIGALKIPGVPCILLAFLAYCGLEVTASLWASSYLVEFRGCDPETAARYASLFYLGLTGGRLLNGFLADRFSDRTLIRAGSAIMLAGMVLLMLPFASTIPAAAGLLIIGLGCAPVYPCIIHSTPANFGAKNSQAIIGIQMASAYMGSTLIPPLFGLIADFVSVSWYPLWLAAFTVLQIAMTERLNAMFKHKTA
ncbi:MAG: MFS transporter [Clostridia bacterium]|nr:MFS transporter [Clostridia bacterium]